MEELAEEMTTVEQMTTAEPEAPMEEPSVDDLHLSGHAMVIYSAGSIMLSDGTCRIYNHGMARGMEIMVDC